MPRSFDEYMSRNRELSYAEAHRRFCDRAGMNEHDLDEMVAREREERAARYREID